ncbi:glycosyl hydrolase family 28-related protein [Paenibacillus segetis]|uniref:Rhamnogalacturonase A/B/Epimerase-like pectate lyase domain-containing protein n=1 Tax=Paenibacillus segetis TaxID=1325360 RepID=A0ABQ1YUS0_9BACL|nr:glycosyl hydrolase family 28-related protein [Paenibacillus segetis]GGH37354.1 hypothetical protein GCM10008013_44750 [Paenibacillus segetis]
MINVTKLGAKGNGVSDDTAAIQKALNQVAQSGETLYFPKGVYMVNPTKTLIVSSNTTITGDGASSIIRAANTGFGWEMVRVSGKNISISGVSLDGNNRVNRVLAIGGGSSQVTVKEAFVANATHSTDRNSPYYVGVVCGIIVYGNSNTITISNTEVSNVISRNLTAGSLIARGIYLTITWGSTEKAAKKVTIMNCYIHHIGPADDGDGIHYEDPGLDNNKGENVGSIITGNRFSYCAKRAIKVYAQGVDIIGNSIENPYLNNNYYMGTNKGSLAPDMYSAISIYGSNNTVVSNKIFGVGSFYGAIEISAAVQVNNIVIQSNNIAMGVKSNLIGMTAIRMGSISNFKVISNTIMYGDKGIWTWQNADQGQIKDNMITLNRGVGIDLTTYIQGYYQKNIIVSGNNITGTTYKIMTSKTTNINVILN